MYACISDLISEGECPSVILTFLLFIPPLSRDQSFLSIAVSQDQACKLAGTSACGMPRISGAVASRHTSCEALPKSRSLRHQAFYRGLRVAILDYHAMIQCHLHPRDFHSLRPGQRSNNERLLTNALCRYYVKSFPFSLDYTALFMTSVCGCSFVRYPT